MAGHPGADALRLDHGNGHAGALEEQRRADPDDAAAEHGDIDRELPVEAGNRRPSGVEPQRGALARRERRGSQASGTRYGGDVNAFARPTTDLTPQRVAELLEEGAVELIDVREPLRVGGGR